MDVVPALPGDCTACRDGSSQYRLLPPVSTTTSPTLAPLFLDFIFLFGLYSRGGLPVLFKYPFSPIFALVKEASLLYLVFSLCFVGQFLNSQFGVFLFILALAHPEATLSL